MRASSSRGGAFVQCPPARRSRRCGTCSMRARAAWSSPTSTGALCADLQLGAGAPTDQRAARGAAGSARGGPRAGRRWWSATGAAACRRSGGRARACRAGAGARAGGGGVGAPLGRGCAGGTGVQRARVRLAGGCAARATAARRNRIAVVRDRRVRPSKRSGSGATHAGRGDGRAGGCESGVGGGAGGGADRDRGDGCRYPGSVGTGSVSTPLGSTEGGLADLAGGAGTARTPQQLWELLAAGGDAVGRFPADRGWDLERLYDPDHDTRYELAREGGFLYDAGEFDASFFGIGPREALAMDPQQRFCWKCAGRRSRTRASTPSRCGAVRAECSPGSACCDYAAGVSGRTARELEGYLATGGAASVVSGRVAYAFGLEGPAVTVDTACSSSLVAMHWACSRCARVSARWRWRVG